MTNGKERQQSAGDLIAAETEKALAQTETARRTLADYRCALVCRGLQTAPLRLKLYASLGLPISHICLILTPEMHRERSEERRVGKEC